MSRCYKCDRANGKLSRRSRCVDCEYESNLFNEKDNEKLREERHSSDLLLARIQHLEQQLADKLDENEKYRLLTKLLTRDLQAHEIEVRRV